MTDMVLTLETETQTVCRKSVERQTEDDSYRTAATDSHHRGWAAASPTSSAHAGLIRLGEGSPYWAGTCIAEVFLKPGDAWSVRGT